MRSGMNSIQGSGNLSDCRAGHERGSRSARNHGRGAERKAERAVVLSCRSGGTSRLLAGVLGSMALSVSCSVSPAPSACEDWEVGCLKPLGTSQGVRHSPELNHRREGALYPGRVVGVAGGVRVESVALRGGRTGSPIRRGIACTSVTAPAALELLPVLGNASSRVLSGAGRIAPAVGPNAYAATRIPIDQLQRTGDLFHREPQGGTFMAQSRASSLGFARCSRIVIALVLAMGGVTSAFGGLPGDDCANPIIVGLGTTSFDVTGATRQLTDHACGPLQSDPGTIWLEFTASSTSVHVAEFSCQGPATGLWILNSPTPCGPYDFEPTAQVDTVHCDFLDDRVRITWCAASGSTYRLLVTTRSETVGTAILSLTTNPASPCSPPSVANDGCAMATVLAADGPFPITGLQDTTAATSTQCDPIVVCNGNPPTRSVWFQWTPNADTGALFQTCGSNYTTSISVRAGSCQVLAPVACESVSTAICDFNPGYGARWLATAGTTYRIVVRDHDGLGGGARSLRYSLDLFPIEIACRFGNHFNDGPAPMDSLTVNSMRGNADRVLHVASSDAFNLDISIGSPIDHTYAVYAWLDPPTVTTVRRLPRRAGTTCMPTPASSGGPQPFRIANTTGHQILGGENWPGPPTRPAPYRLLSLPQGLMRQGTFFLQGIVKDRDAGSPLAQVTNGIVVVSE